MTTKIAMNTVLQFLSLVVCGYLLIWILCIKLTGLSQTGNPSREIIALAVAIISLAAFSWWQSRKSTEKKPKTYWYYVLVCMGAGMAATATLDRTFGSNTLLGIGNMIIFAMVPIIIIGSFRTRKRIKN